MIDQEKIRELIRKALEARQRAYVPYSHFQVGAALLCGDGRIFGGCNIENSSYGAANCAERTAFFRAVYEGERDFAAIAIAGGPEGEDPDICPPCGICRQVMAEFCDLQEFMIILARNENEYETYRLTELLPQAFTPDSLLKR
ncbi:MAG: cytidine deaminase [Blautia sp.]|nr:cytidine deaminase [Blautia sp.]